MVELTITWTHLIVAVIAVWLIVRYYATAVTQRGNMHRVEFELDQPSLEKAEGEVEALHNRVRALIKDAAHYNEIAAKQK